MRDGGVSGQNFEKCGPGEAVREACRPGCCHVHEDGLVMAITNEEDSFT